MSNTHRRPLGQVSNWHPATNEVTPASRQSTFVPHGLTLRHTILGGTITNVTASAGTITYTCRNNFVAGDIISIINVLPVAYNLTNVAVLASGLSSTQFRVTNAATGTYVSGGNAFTYFQIPTGVTWVYALVVGGGGSGNNSANGAGGGGGVAWNWTPASNICIVGSGGASGSINQGNYSRYGNVIAGGGAAGGAGPLLGGGGSSNQGGNAGSTNYWGIPGGAAVGNNANGSLGAGAGGGGVNFAGTGFTGGNGISGGGGGTGGGTGLDSVTGGNGGSGLVGGGGGNALSATICTGGNGGNGLGIDGTIYTGGTGSTGSAATAGGGGGGAGIAANGSNASGANGGNGGLGGGGGGCKGINGVDGSGGNGIVYLWY